MTRAECVIVMSPFGLSDARFTRGLDLLSVRYTSPHLPLRFYGVLLVGYRPLASAILMAGCLGDRWRFLVTCIPAVQTPI